MIRFLANVSNWKIILPFFLFTTFLLYLFLSGQQEMSAIVGAEVTLIDLWKSYDLESVNTFFIQLQPEGRAIHQQLTGEVDMIFPFAYGPFFILVFAFLLKNIFGNDSKWILLSLFPILLMGVDYMENFNTLKMLHSFPDLKEALVDRGSFLTETKHIFSSIINISVVLLVGVWVAKIFLPKKN